MTDKEAIEKSKHLGDVLVQARLASQVVVNASTMKCQIVWTADGLAFRNAVFKAYEAVAEGQHNNNLMEFCNVIGYIITER